jgi:hypothetical protein
VVDAFGGAIYQSVELTLDLRKALNRLKAILGQSLGRSIGPDGEVAYEVRGDCLFQVGPTGHAREICALEQIEFWSEDEKLKVLTLGLKDGRRLIIKDSRGLLFTLLKNRAATARQRD